MTGQSPESLRTEGHILNLLAQAMAAHRSGRLVEAEPLYRRALAVVADDAVAWNAWGVLLMQTGRVAEATESWRSALAVDSGHAGAWANLGAALHGQGRLDEATESYHRAITLDPLRPEAHYNLGSAVQEMGRLDEAADHYRRALELRPAYPQAWNNLGITLRDLGRLDEAMAAYRGAIAVLPDHAEAHYNLGMALLEAGDLAAGFDEYEWRFGAGVSTARDYPQPLWRGEDLTGRTLLVWPEQGFGDSLQFLRYIPLLAARGIRVIVEVQKPLVRLVRGMPGAVAVVASGDPLPAFDVHVPLVSLPQRFATTLDHMPAAPPYLYPPATAVAVWRDHLPRREGWGRHGGALRVGLVWAGNPNQKNDANRSLPAAFLPALVGRDSVEFYALQVGDAARALASPGLERVRDLSPLLTDFAETAAALLALDLVITVDTSVAHLAGALGVPVWVMLTLRPDWRYLRLRDDCPWYPSMRLYRQERLGAWDEVIRRLAGDLDALGVGKGLER
jgi:Flp pilus assembly protein TadD